MKVAVVHGTDHARKFLHHIKESGEHFDFVEVMTCPGGCISGGGQTKHIGEDMDTVRTVSYTHLTGMGRPPDEMYDSKLKFMILFFINKQC